MYYTVFCPLTKKKVIIPKIRIGVFVIGGIFVTGLVPGIFFWFLFAAIGGFSPTIRLITLFIFFFYFSVIGFMIIIKRDHKRLINDQLQDINA